MTKYKWLALLILGLAPISCSAQDEVTTQLPAIPGSVEAAKLDVSQYPQIQAWLKNHKPADFTGKTWVRFRVREPQEYSYAVIVDSETNPYKPARTPTGTVWATGLQPVTWPADKIWGQPLPWVAPATENDWLKSGEYSVWVELPTSKAKEWHSAFIVRPKEKTQPLQVNLDLEFASATSEDAIFYTVSEPTDDKGAALVRMPTEGGIFGMKMVESFTAWAQRRRRFVQSLNLKPAPRAKHLRIGTWATYGNYRAPGTGGTSTRQQVEPDFQTYADLGLNSVSPTGLNPVLFRELATKYGIIDTTLTGWTTMWRYTTEGYAGKYNYLPGETPPQRWARVFDDYYAKMAARYKVQIPASLEIAEHLVLGDEPHPTTSVKEIMETPALLFYFRSWLQARKHGDATWTPQFFGAQSWDTIEPLDDRKIVDDPAVSAASLRRYYWTWQFINDYSIMYYKAATNAVKKHFPKVKLIATNYQSGPVQNAFIGQSNAMSRGNIDIFEIGRQNAMQGVMMEDWVASTDLGAGFTLFGADVMRSAARKHDLPLAAYIVGFVPRPRFYAWMMQGVKEFGLYLYGPVSNFGPAWAEHEPTLREIRELTREVQKFDSEIAAARLRPTRAAMLVANTSDIMQSKSVYFTGERQHLYLALRHSGVPVDLVSEQDIVEDNLLEKYSLLYVSDPQVRSDVQRKVAGWVQSGGHLWAGAGAMCLDEYSAPSSVMNEVFGVSKNEMAIQPGGFRWAATFYSARIGKFNFKEQGKIKLLKSEFTPAGEITTWGLRIDATPTTGRVLGSYNDGKPAVILNNYGRGTALLVGALVGEAYVRERYVNVYPVKDNGHTRGALERQLATALIESAKIEKPVELSEPGIYTSVMEAPGATLVFLNKAFEAPVSPVNIRLKDPGKVSGVESAKLGKVPHKIEGGVLSVQLALQNSDILRINNHR